MSDGTSKLRVMISGRVQGVGFRYSLAQVAERHGVGGWCRNRHDETVEAVLIGDERAVQKVLAWCHRGPAMAQVDRVDVTPAPDEPLTSTFHIRG